MQAILHKWMIIIIRWNYTIGPSSFKWVLLVSQV